jgi:hypothetical protein
VTVTVTAEHGTQRVYTVVVTRDTPTGAEPVNALKVYAAGGALHIVAPSATAVHIYNVAGECVKALQAPAGETALPLPRGVYIVKTGAKTGKVWIK